MVSKRQIKIITSLHQKKYRKSTGLFVAEGKKVIDEFLSSHFQLDSLFTTAENLFATQPKVTVISEAELKKISFLKTPNKALALFKISDDKIASADGFTVPACQKCTGLEIHGPRDSLTIRKRELSC